MKLAVLTPACGRTKLTEKTLGSFCAMNRNAMPAVRLMALDQSSYAEDTANAFTAEAYGWRVCAIAMGRQGLMWGLRWLVLEAKKLGCDHILWLENDWDSFRQIPSFPDGLGKGVDCCRLYGNQKQLDGKRPAGKINMVTGEPIRWGRVPGMPGWEMAEAHFGGAPSIIRLDRILPHIGQPTMKDMAMAMGSLDTIRPEMNCFWHMGMETTPDFKA